MLDRFLAKLARRRPTSADHGVLASLLSGAIEGTTHVLTIATEDSEFTTYLKGTSDYFSTSDSEAGSALSQAVETGRSAALVLRTLNSEPYLLQGVAYDGYTVRGWYLWEGYFRPQTEGECFTAFCTDAVTGDPVAPELGVTYASGYTVTYG